LKIALIAGNLDQHKALVRIETFGHAWRWPETMDTESARITQDEVVDPFLWLQPFIVVLVCAKDNFDATFQEDRFKLRRKS
jgi:hypothetical protein